LRARVLHLEGGDDSTAACAHVRAERDAYGARRGDVRYSTFHASPCQYRTSPCLRGGREGLGWAPAKAEIYSTFLLLLLLLLTPASLRHEVGGVVCLALTDGGRRFGLHSSTRPALGRYHLATIFCLRCSTRAADGCGLEGQLAAAPPGRQKAGAHSRSRARARARVHAGARAAPLAWRPSVGDLTSAWTHNECAV
jgi:hypothetical protein